MMADIFSSIENLGQQAWPIRSLGVGTDGCGWGRKTIKLKLLYRKGSNGDKTKTEFKGIKSLC